MKTIICLSDTHGVLDPRILPYLEGVDEIWHAGDIGDPSMVQVLENKAILRSVYGNIDDHRVRSLCPEWAIWQTEEIKIMMTHIAGRPPKYNPTVLEKIKKERPKIFICGHSHILLVQYVESLDCLHLNPGACGKQGWHKVQTLLRFQINGSDIKNMEVIELQRKINT